MVEESRQDKNNHSIKTIFLKILRVLFILFFVGILVCGLSVFFDGLKELIFEIRDLMPAKQLNILGEKIEITPSLTMGTKLVIGILTISIILFSFFITLIKKILNIIFK